MRNPFFSNENKILLSTDIPPIHGTTILGSTTFIVQIVLIAFVAICILLFSLVK